MKAATVIAVALATFSSFPSTAQQQPAQQQQQQQQQPSSQQQDQQVQQPAPHTGGSQAQQSAGNAQAPAAAMQLTPVTGELVKELDSKSAKAGDSVVLKTSEDAKFPGGAEIPKGSKLVGHVTTVQAREEGKENSEITIQFDRAQVKGGKEVAIDSAIQSLSPAVGSDSAVNNGVPVNPQTPSGAASTDPGMSNSSNRPGAASNPTPQPGTSQAGTAQPGVAQDGTTPAGTADHNSTSAMPAPGSIVARNGNVAVRITAIPGVLLANDIHGLPFSNASGMLLGARRDIHLDGGTQMVIAVVAAPQGAGGGMSR